MKDKENKVVQSVADLVWNKNARLPKIPGYQSLGQILYAHPNLFLTFFIPHNGILQKWFMFSDGRPILTFQPMMKQRI